MNRTKRWSNSNRGPSPPLAGPKPFSFGLDSVSQLFGLDRDEEYSDPLLGVDIGGATLIRLVGEGGMGRVYEARQERPSRSVAVKIMRPGFGSRETYRRFLREAEILGKLRHPCIAQIYAAGVCPMAGTRVPFFIMEYIPDALPVTEYARVHGLRIEERLRMMQMICDAVAHGHQQGVVHRDLKPGNILVDGGGQPKVIDFGVARFEAADFPPVTALTGVGQMIGTLQYMSPEQLSAESSDIDGRADIYSLGVVFHELLANRLPYDISGRGLLDAARVIMEHVPDPHVMALQPEYQTLQGIVAKCLNKDRTLRYASARELTASLANYRANRRVSATPRSASIAPKSPEWLNYCLHAAMLCISIAILNAWFRAGVFNRDLATMRPPVRRSAENYSAVLPKPSEPIGVSQVAAERKAAIHQGTGEMLSVEEAKTLVAMQRPLELPTVRNVDAKVAEILSKVPGTLSLNGIRMLSPEAAGQLSRQRGTLCLDGLQGLTVEAASALAAHAGWLNLGGLRDISHAALARLVTHRGGMAVNLPGPMDHERAILITRHAGQLYVLGVEAVDTQAAELLVAHDGPLALDVQMLSSGAEAVLARNPHVYRFFNR